MNQITTTLAQSKKLKELGAPDNTERSWFSNERVNGNNGEWDIRLESTHWDYNPKHWKKIFAAYTLQELIEWLGDDFGSLTNYFDFDSLKGAPFIAKQSGVSKDSDGLVFEGRGATPLEAVYNLCKAIHGKEVK